MADNEEDMFGTPRSPPALGGDAAFGVDIDKLVAAPGVAPLAWQSRAPDSVFTGVKPPITRTPDLERVGALKRRPQLDPDSERALRLVQLMTARYKRDRSEPCACRAIDPKRFVGNPNACITELNVAQSWTLYEAGIVQGWLGAVGVGFGKTIIDILGALALADGWAAWRERRGETASRAEFTVLLMVPPGLIDQLHVEYRLLAEHFRVPAIVFHTRPIRYDVENEPKLHVMPYSKLSRPESTTFLSGLAPHALIMDECDAVQNVESTRGGRIWSYVQANPTTRCGGHTGTLTDSSITQYSPMSAMCLKDSSPVPLDSQVAREWASALDPDDEWRADPGALMDMLVETGCQQQGENIYVGFHRRLTETMGFVATRDSAITAGLEILERSPAVDGSSSWSEDDVPNTPRPDPTAPDGEGWPGVATCLESIRNGVRPDGEELLEDGAFAIARCAREMASGFFYRWVFYNGEPDELIKRWRQARKNFRKAQREALKQRREHLDSPFLLQLAAMRHCGDIPRGERVEVIDTETGNVKHVDTSHLPTWDAEGTWVPWRDVAGLVKPTSEPVWIDEFLARDAAEWALSHRGVVWYDHTAFGRMVGKLAKLHVYEGGRENVCRLVGGEFKGRQYPGEDGSRSVVCSINSHGTGRNGLQYLFGEQLVSNPPSSNRDWEQLLGRLHRIGQPRPVVRTWFYQHTRETKKHVAQALRRALYVASTLGSNQKLRVGFDLAE